MRTVSHNEGHLRVIPIEGDAPGLAIWANHPAMGVGRIVVVKAMDPEGFVVGCGEVGPDLDLNDAINSWLNKSAGLRSAKPVMAVTGAQIDTAHILELLCYPTDDREHVSSELADAIIEQRPAPLLGMVDARAVSALHAVFDPTLSDLAFYSGDGERPQRRRQAATAFPLFAGKISTTLSLKMAADRAKPLKDEVIKSLDCKTGGSIGKGAINKLASIKEPPYRTDLDTVIEFASRVAPDWIPTSGEEWQAFCIAAEAIVRKLGVAAEDTAPLIKGCGGRWVDYCKRIAAAAAGQDGQIGSPDFVVPIAMHDLNDMIECFSNVVVLPLAAHGTGQAHVIVTPELRQRCKAVARMMLLGERSSHVVADLSRRWHGQSAAILDATRQAADEARAALLGDVVDGGWPLLTDPIRAPNGVWLVPLGTPKLLEWEGLHGIDPTGASGLHHCVGGYSSKCLDANCHIVSVRNIADDGSYERLSTIEFDRIKPGDDRLSIIQNRGMGNGQPSSAARDATDWFVSGVLGRRIPLFRDRINAFQELRSGEMNGVERFCGFDWRNRNLLNAAVTPWGPFVDSAWKKYGLDALIESETLAWVREAIAPELITAMRR